MSDASLKLMRYLLVLLPAVLLAQAPPAAAPKPAPATAPAARPAAAPKPALAASASTPTTDEEKTVYAIGLALYRSLEQFSLTPAEMELVTQGLKDAAAKKPAEDVNVWGPKIQPMATARAAKIAEKQKAISAAYITKAAAESGATKTDSGMIYREQRAGTGESPKETDTVRVNYRGTLIDGTEFDSSYKRNEPAQFPLNGVIKCWTEGLQKMKPGGKATLVCPSDLAYGDQGRPSIPGGAALVFEVELLDIVAATPPAPPAPAPAK
jgi:FKBP-type peptidyl-prolyl cis-trans isomerase FkpA